MTCSYCEHILRGCTIKHRRFECPYRRAMYCHKCGIFGHQVSECPTLTLRISDSEKTIRTYLLIHDITPTNKQEKNKDLLLDLANSMEPPRKLIFTALKAEASKAK